MKDIIFVFDGQGAFRPGVGKELCAKYPRAREVVDESSKILGYDLTEYLWGEKSETTAGRTSIAQPAISTVSLAYAEVLRDLGVEGKVSLGHSLGEATAIVYTGIVGFGDGIKMIMKRGEVMEAGGGQGTMMAVLNIDIEVLEDICQQATKEVSEPVVVANINAPNQIVVSGSKTAIKRVAQRAAEKSGRAIPLNVGGAWHSPFLEDAAVEFTTFLDGIEFSKPRRQFYSVVDQIILEEPVQIKESLKKQMLSRVNWIDAINNLKGKDIFFLEIGPSKILRDLIARIDQNSRVDSVALYGDLGDLIAKL
ncbi:MAG: ACP S-malonyltransferase [candidate division WOR-3 bacterium]|nr:MAG: ACP S-malonyltransferase [candidate division WOR-3 bacterium]